MSSKNPANPNNKGADTYNKRQTAAGDTQRSLEARALLKAAKLLNDLQSSWSTDTPESLEQTLKFNRQIWIIFYDSAVQNGKPPKADVMRSNVISLANFVFSKSLDILAEPEKDKLNILININREVAAGLMTASGPSA